MQWSVAGKKDITKTIMFELILDINWWFRPTLEILKLYKKNFKNRDPLVYIINRGRRFDLEEKHRKLETNLMEK